MVSPSAATAASRLHTSWLTTGAGSTTGTGVTTTGAGVTTTGAGVTTTGAGVTTTGTGVTTTGAGVTTTGVAAATCTATTSTVRDSLNTAFSTVVSERAGSALMLRSGLGASSATTTGWARCASRSIAGTSCGLACSRSSDSICPFISSDSKRSLPLRHGPRLALQAGDSGVSMMAPV